MGCYTVSVSDFGSEVDVTFFDRPVFFDRIMCDDYGVIPDRKSRFYLNDPELAEAGFLPVNCDPDSAYADFVDWYGSDERKEHNLDSSVRRTQAKITALCRSQQWEWFLTFTFSPQVVDRYNWDAVTNLMKKYLNNMKKQNSDMLYIIVPEKHKDGAYHFHGLFASAPALRIAPYGDKYYTVNSFPYGYSSASPVVNPQASARYISKYISKDVVQVSKGKKRYWASRSLKVPDKIVLAPAPADKQTAKERLLAAAAHVSEINIEVTSLTKITLSRVQYLSVVHALPDVLPDLCL